MTAKRQRPEEAPRPLTCERGLVHHAHGSALTVCGRTKVLCTVTVTDSVPPWMSGRGAGWLTAEYSMLPGSTKNRKQREGRNGRVDPRSQEIQRLIGRSLRAAVQLEKLPEITLWVDCDVLAADGGTRTTAINGAMIALHDALTRLKEDGRFRKWPIEHLVSGTSVGLVGDRMLVDLDYSEDSSAAVDLNVVRRSDGKLIEVQGSAEKAPFDDDQLARMLALSKSACGRIDAVQREILGLAEVDS